MFLLGDILQHSSSLFFRLLLLLTYFWTGGLLNNWQMSGIIALLVSGYGSGLLTQVTWVQLMLKPF